MEEARWWDPEPGGDALRVRVRVTPGARRSEVLGVAGDRLRLKVAAPPVEGKANAAVVREVAALFGLRPSAVTILRGGRSRDKDLRVSGVAAPPPELLAL